MLLQARMHDLFPADFDAVGVQENLTVATLSARRVHFYPYKCVECGTPHRHRNGNKFPDLCKSCAIRKAQWLRRQREFKV